MANKRKIAAFLAEVIEWEWDKFMKAEVDPNYTTGESMVFALVRACVMENPAAIQTAVDRIDGKSETPVEIVLPKVFYVFPNAPVPIVIEAPKDKELTLDVDLTPVNDSPTKGLRDVAERMSEAKRSVPSEIIVQQEMAEEWFATGTQRPTYFPYVKSVIVARMFRMAHKRKMGMINQLFDDIDGKLVEKIKVMGDDMYITQFGTVAPPGAYVNEHGVMQLEATQVQALWQAKLGTKKGMDIIEGN